MWACSSKVGPVLLAASVSFLSPAMLHQSRNCDRNKTSTHYKAIIQFWWLSITNQGKSSIDKNTCIPVKPSELSGIVNIHPSRNLYMFVHMQ